MSDSTPVFVGTTFYVKNILNPLFKDQPHFDTDDVIPKLKNEPVLSEQVGSKLAQTGKPRMKATGATLVMCLNPGIDAPDVLKKNDKCARMQCWINIWDMDPKNVFERLKAALTKQYEYQLGTKCNFQFIPDASVAELQKKLVDMRKRCRKDRILFHYNGHGVPRPTKNMEIWFFNQKMTQYMPVNYNDIHTWAGTPTVHVLDCHSAGTILAFYRKLYGKVTHENEKLVSDTKNFLRPQFLMNFKTNLDKTDIIKEVLVLCACSHGETLPLDPRLPADLFTACLTTPVRASFLLHSVKQDRLLVNESVLKNIINKNMLPQTEPLNRKPIGGQILWILTAILDTIAWNNLDHELFHALMRLDNNTQLLIRHFLLAQYILGHFGVTPVSFPHLPDMSGDPMWETWHHVLDCTILHIAKFGEESAANYFDSVTFFKDQMDSFDHWLRTTPNASQEALRSADRAPLLPVLLQIILNQTHRVEGLKLIAQFVAQSGQAGVKAVLWVGLMPYLHKLIVTPQNAENATSLVTIWARIVSEDSPSYIDLLRDPTPTPNATKPVPHGYTFFTDILMKCPSPTTNGGTEILVESVGYGRVTIPSNGALAAFTLACITNNYTEFQARPDPETVTQERTAIRQFAIQAQSSFRQQHQPGFGGATPGSGVKSQYELSPTERAQKFANDVMGACSDLLQRVMSGPATPVPQGTYSVKKDRCLVLWTLFCLERLIRNNVDAKKLLRRHSTMDLLRDIIESDDPNLPPETRAAAVSCIGALLHHRQPVVPPTDSAVIAEIERDVEHLRRLLVLAAQDGAPLVRLEAVVGVTAFAVRAGLFEGEAVDGRRTPTIIKRQALKTHSGSNMSSSASGSKLFASSFDQYATEIQSTIEQLQKDPHPVVSRAAQRFMHRWNNSDSHVSGSSQKTPGHNGPAEQVSGDSNFHTIHGSSNLASMLAPGRFGGEPNMSISQATGMTRSASQTRNHSSRSESADGTLTHALSEENLSRGGATSGDTSPSELPMWTSLFEQCVETMRRPFCRAVPSRGEDRFFLATERYASTTRRGVSPEFDGKGRRTTFNDLFIQNEDPLMSLNTTPTLMRQSSSILSHTPPPVLCGATGFPNLMQRASSYVFPASNPSTAATPTNAQINAIDNMRRTCAVSAWDPKEHPQFFEEVSFMWSGTPINLNNNLASPSVGANLGAYQHRGGSGGHDMRANSRSEFHTWRCVRFHARRRVLALASSQAWIVLGLPESSVSSDTPLNGVATRRAAGSGVQGVSVSVCHEFHNPSSSQPVAIRFIDEQEPRDLMMVALRDGSFSIHAGYHEEQARLSVGSLARYQPSCFVSSTNANIQHFTHQAKPTLLHAANILKCRELDTSANQSMMSTPTAYQPFVVDTEWLQTAGVISFLSPNNIINFDAASESISTRVHLSSSNIATAWQASCFSALGSNPTDGGSTDLALRNSYAVGFKQGQVRLYDARVASSGSDGDFLGSHDAAITAIHTSHGEPSDRNTMCDLEIVSNGTEGKIKVWDVRKPRTPIKQFVGEKGVISFSVHPHFDISAGCRATSPTKLGVNWPVVYFRSLHAQAQPQSQTQTPLKSTPNNPNGVPVGTYTANGVAGAFHHQLPIFAALIRCEVDAKNASRLSILRQRVPIDK